MRRLEEGGRAQEEKWEEVMAAHNRAWKQALAEEKERGRRELAVERERGRKELRDAERRWEKKLERAMEETRERKVRQGVSQTLGWETTPPRPNGCRKPVSVPDPRARTISPIRIPVSPISPLSGSRSFFPPLPIFPLQKDLNAPLPSPTQIPSLMPLQARVEREDPC